MNAGHRVRVPGWTCAGDGFSWPCAEARAALAVAFRADRWALTRLMVGLLRRAADDLERPDPAVLFQRFVGWTLSRDAGCRVCGGVGHAVLAGPPRLFPCPEVREFGWAREYLSRVRDLRGPTGSIRG